MTLLIFFAAIAVWAVLRHQQRRHIAELSRECARRGLQLTDPSPAVPALESVLTVVVAVTLITFSAAVLVGAFAAGEADQWKLLWHIASVGLAAGMALFSLAIRSLAAVRRTSAAK